MSNAFTYPVNEALESSFGEDPSAHQFEWDATSCMQVDGRRGFDQERLRFVSVDYSMSFASKARIQMMAATRSWRRAMLPRGLILNECATQRKAVNVGKHK